MTEREILLAIEEATKDKKDAKHRQTFHKKAAIDAESDLIEANIKIERLKDQLRRFREAKVPTEPSEDEKRIEEFRKRLPAILEKLKG